MSIGVLRRRRALRPLSVMVLVSGLLATLTFGFTSVASVEARGSATQTLTRGSRPAAAFATTKAYVEQFYPLWFTYLQSTIAPHNQLLGPDRISPVYQGVVAINDDTLYASTPLDLRGQCGPGCSFPEPAILTVPATQAGYSVLTLSPYGDIYSGLVPSKASGAATRERVYALTPPGYSGKLPAGVTRVDMPLNLMTLIYRVDKYSPAHVNQIQEATEFRAALRLQSLSGYLLDRSVGATKIFPEYYFAIPFKTAADSLVRVSPITFLGQLQTAVHSSNTPALSPQEQALSDRFDSLFAARSGRVTRAALKAGARAAHAAIQADYLTHLGPNNWIHFTNMGDWQGNALDRSAITEFIQYGNGIATAAYYHTFRDRHGSPLVGSSPHGYRMTFRAPHGQPAAERFWSLTAYTPHSIELIPNLARKYVVASYTPGLKVNRDQSVTIFISRRRPAGVPRANWLPVSNRPFNVMLRVYGVKPGSSVANNTYIPPAVVKSHRR